MKSFTLIAISTIFTTVIASAVPASAADVAWADSVKVTKVSLSAERVAEIEHSLATNATGLVARQGGCYFQAFTGNSCNVNGGSQIGIDNNGHCIGTGDRHSFFISAGCPVLNVGIYNQVNCAGGLVSTREGPGCYNVNTGGNWQSSFVSR